MDQYTQRYKWYQDRIKVWMFSIQTWQLAVPVVWLAGAIVLGVVGHFALGFSLPWWAYILGFPFAVLISAGRSRLMQRLWVFLGFPYLLRKKSTEPTDKPLMGLTGRLFFRLGNALGLSVWSIWPIDVTLNNFAYSLVYGVVFSILYIVFLSVTDRFVLFKRTRLAIVLFLLLWLTFITNYISWEYYSSGRQFCPFFICLGGG